MKQKTNAKTFIRALTVILFIIWTFVCAYLISGKSSPVIYDYANELVTKEENLVHQAIDLMRTNPHSAQLIDICHSLCQIKICQKQSLPAIQYLANLFNIANNVSNDWQKSTLYLFGGNIYRECGKFKQSQEYYQKSLFILNVLQISKKTNINIAEIKINEAKNLNNLGIVSYLLGKTASTKEECRKNYTDAKNYFEQANDLLPKNQNICLNRSIQNNIDECLIELKFLD